MMRTWKCRTCGYTVDLSYEDLAVQGVPLCGQPGCQGAGDDMELPPAVAGAEGVYIRFECGQEDRVSREYGPFPFVQLTCDALRVGPDGDDFAHLDGADGFWHVGDGKEKWSDVVIAGPAAHTADHGTGKRAGTPPAPAPAIAAKPCIPKNALFVLYDYDAEELVTTRVYTGAEYDDAVADSNDLPNPAMIVRLDLELDDTQEEVTDDDQPQ